MKKIKQNLIKFPEYYLIVLAVLCGYTPPFTLNILSLVFIAILISQIVFKNKILGLIISSIFLLINLFMLGALISELNEFTEFNIKAKQLLFGGLSLWCLNMLSSSIMIYKYAKPYDTRNSQNDFKTQEV